MLTDLRPVVLLLAAMRSDSIPKIQHQSTKEPGCAVHPPNRTPEQGTHLHTHPKVLPKAPHGTTSLQHAGGRFGKVVGPRRSLRRMGM